MIQYLQPTSKVHMQIHEADLRCIAGPFGSSMAREMRIIAMVMRRFVIRQHVDRGQIFARLWIQVPAEHRKRAATQVEIAFSALQSAKCQQVTALLPQPIHVLHGPL